jgi:alkylation response protein AidB-like acyl-CoA dehydrogenase
MQKLDSEAADLGSRTFALAADALNKTITLVNDHRLTRWQYIMFALADMMTHVEVGRSLARKAFKSSNSGEDGAEKIKIISRLFACEVAQVVSHNILKIVMGSGEFDQQTISDFMAGISYDELTASFRGMIQDMDQLADIIFER